MTKQKFIDLAELTPTETTTITLKHPVTDEELPITITVLGQDSDGFEKALFKIHAKAKNNKASSEEDPEYIELLADAIVSWKGVGLHCNELKCTKANKMKVLKSVKWIRRQVNLAIVDRSRFFPASSKG